MNDLKNCIYLFSHTPILNIDFTPPLEKLSKHSTVYLNSLLYSNYIKLFENLGTKTEIVYCLDIKDREFIPKYFFPKGSTVYFLDYKSTDSHFDEFNKNFFLRYNRNLLISYNSIGIKPGDINKIFNLLSKEDSSVLLGRSQTDNVVLLGCNNILPDIFKLFLSNQKDYNDFLVQISNMDIFVNTLSGILEISNFREFKKLYKELAKKESIDYCNTEMHESFTNLFVEYKEQLDE